MAKYVLFRKSPQHKAYRVVLQARILLSSRVPSRVSIARSSFTTTNCRPMGVETTARHLTRMPVRTPGPRVLDVHDAQGRRPRRLRPGPLLDGSSTRTFACVSCLLPLPTRFSPHRTRITSVLKASRCPVSTFYPPKNGDIVRSHTDYIHRGADGNRMGQSDLDVPQQWAAPN
ncbi:hypothetical protein BD310DRAFT_726922 [Dichomitus squalens]|uniref:Uncharacterized protein n=1 Tax=Dichomitus squalens TaxID=114155 RepID=A0A4Q9PL46_9APHY|nr:hypothetical protein BD310DRAFT_726922 [Dichomitus squalens]